jgi:squalene-hopene/tetraprenyl-beta-curcumene cyclase
VIERGIDYLATQQNPDGGFGDTDLSHSNIATTMLVRAAFYLADASRADSEPQRNSATLGRHRELLHRATKYIEVKGGVDGLRARYGKDKTFAVPILTNCALAGLVDWREVSPLPFELAAFPQSWYRFFHLPVVSYAIPALVAIGQARFFHVKPRNPLTRAMRAASVRRTLAVLERMQPASGGYLEAIPLTSFVAMSLAGTGRADHPVAQRGVQFLLNTVRPDGSWPIDTNLATWVTTLAINALEGSGFRVQGSEVRSAECGVRSVGNVGNVGNVDARAIEWLLSCQHNERHPFTGAAPGGWGWSDLSGAVPDVDDTSGALLALATFADPAKFERRAPHGPGLHGRAYSAAIRGTCWLLNLQNRDGGWPTFCRGWGALPFDRSSPDLTAHAMRAIYSWFEFGRGRSSEQNRFVRRIERGFRYLANSQRPDGSWVPLWFGNQDHPDEENHVYGTSRVLLAYRDLQRLSDDAAVRGLQWLIANQNADGGWGAAAQGSGFRVQRSGGYGRSKSLGAVLNTSVACGSSVEETAWAVEGLLAGLDNGELATDNSVQNAIRQGVDWLVRAVEDRRHRQPAPVGFYFAKLWYYERLYPLVFAVAALGEAAGRTRGAIEPVTVKESGNDRGKR